MGFEGPGSGSEGLESMPSEIVSRVCSFLPLKPHETGYPVLGEFTENRRALRQLCLTSRQLLHAAAPFLYRVIIIQGPRRLMTYDGSTKFSPLLLLLRTLLENPQLRLYVRHIACLVNLKDSRHGVSSQELEGIRQLWNSVCQGTELGVPLDARILDLADLPSSKTSIAGAGPGQLVMGGPNNGDEQDCHQAVFTAAIPAGSNLDDLGERVFAAILCLSSNLDSVVFQMPHCSRASAPSNLDSIRCAITSRIIDSALRDQLVGPTVLQKLTTVKVQADMQAFIYHGWEPPLSGMYGDGDDDDGDDGDDSERGVRVDACPGLFNAPNITTVEGFKESGGWDALPRGTKDIRLYGPVEPTTLGTICGYPNLERLTVQPAPLEMPIPADPADDVFNSALDRRADTLEYLDFMTLGNDTLAPCYGPSKRLHCLPRLRRLQDLSIELFALLGSSDAIGRLLLQDTLPPNLRRLCLFERWTFGDPILSRGSGGSAAPTANDDDILAAYRRKLMDALISLAESCPARLPGLRTFEYARHSDLAEMRAGRGSGLDGGGRSDFDRLRNLFAEAGVEFELALF